MNTTNATTNVKGELEHGFEYWRYQNVQAALRRYEDTDVWGLLPGVCTITMVLLKRDLKRALEIDDYNGKNERLELIEQVRALSMKQQRFDALLHMSVDQWQQWALERFLEIVRYGWPKDFDEYDAVRKKVEYFDKVEADDAGDTDDGIGTNLREMLTRKGRSATISPVRAALAFLEPSRAYLDKVMKRRYEIYNWARFETTREQRARYGIDAQTIIENYLVMSEADQRKVRDAVASSTTST